MPTGKAITAGQKEAIVTLRRTGHTYQAIADKLNLGVSTVERHAHDVTQDNPKRRRYSPSDIAKARQLRATGMTLDTIAQRTGMLLVSVHRYVKDVPVPKTPHQISKGATTYKREQRELSKRSTLDNYPSNTEDPPSYDGTYAPTVIPTDPTPYDRTGLLPDPNLVMYCQDILAGYIEELEAGRKRFPTEPIYVVQARYIWLHSWEVWNYEWFLANNQAWRSIREMAKVSSQNIAQRVGISYPSITRYEKGQRSPDPRRLQELWRAYTGVHEEALTNHEMALALHSLTDAHEDSPIWSRDDSPHEQRHKISLWLSGMTTMDNSDEPLTIEHLAHLAKVRTLMPTPDWRTPTQENWGLVGYM